jgi:hypothetical protein
MSDASLELLQYRVLEVIDDFILTGEDLVRVLLEDHLVPTLFEILYRLV